VAVESLALLAREALEIRLTPRRLKVITVETMPLLLALLRLITEAVAAVVLLPLVRLEPGQAAATVALVLHQQFLAAP
jgi:hypothetical protein